MSTSTFSAKKSTSTAKRNKILEVVAWADLVWQQYLIRKQQVISETQNIIDINSEYMYSYDVSGNKNVYSYTMDISGNVTIGDVVNNTEIPEDNSASVDTDFSSLGKPPHSFLDILNTP